MPNIIMLQGTSGVGKTTLMKLLADKYDAAVFRCSARDGVATRPELLVDGHPDWDQMIGDPAYCHILQRAVARHFRRRIHDLIALIQQKAYPLIVLERSPMDVHFYTDAYARLGDWMKLNQKNYWMQSSDLFESEIYAWHSMNILSSWCASYFVGLHVVHVPINNDYPYDQQNGARPPLNVRDGWEACFWERTRGILVSRDSSCLKLQPDSAENYADKIMAEVERRQIAAGLL